MTARVEIATDPAAAVDGGRRAERDLRCVRDGFASPDQLLHGVMDAVEVDGQSIKPTPRLRAYLRTLQKAIEQGRRS